MKRKQVLLLLDGIVLFGRERGNIDVMVHLKNRQQPVMVAVHENWGRRQVTPYLDQLSIPWCELDMHDRIGRHTGIKQALVAAFVIAKANVQLAWRLLKTPTAMLQISNPHTMLSFLPLLWLVRTPIVMRCGDCPATHTAAHRWLWSMGFRRVNQVVAISRFVADALLEAGCPPERLKIIHSRGFRRPARTAKPCPLPGLHSGPLVLGFIGQLEAHKGVDHLLKACQELHNSGLEFELQVAGRPTEFWAQLVPSYANAPWLKVLGFVSDTVSYFAAIDLLVVPSVFAEPLGAVVLEAKQQGVAAVVYPSGGLAEMISNGVDGQVCGQPTVDSLRQCLGQLCGSPKQVAAMGLAAKQSAEDFERGFEQGWDQVYGL